MLVRRENGIVRGDLKHLVTWNLSAALGHIDS